MTRPLLPPFYASVGPRLTQYTLDPDTLELRVGSEAVLPAAVHYVWPHPRRKLLYVAASNRFFTPRDEGHCLAVVPVDPATGALGPVGKAVPLRSRPIHVTVDAAGTHALVVFNNPAGIAVYRIEADGSLGAEVAQEGPLDLGIYPHQVRVAPHDAFVVVPVRGNNATDTRAEDPGSLRVFDWHGGQLTPAQTVAPHGGLGFGPRHVTFHPTQPWMFVSLERQQELQVYAVEGNRIGSAPLHRVSTLRRPEDAGPDQLAGTVHVHPSGDFVYLPNRTDTMAGADGKILFRGGDNTLAVFRIDRATGEPVRIQNLETGSYHIRTFSIAGDLLVGASIAPCKVPGPDGSMAIVPASLAFFRIGGDGTLAFERRVEIDTTGGMLFWSGFLEAYRPAAAVF
ncbi:MAG: beta-propeller fold lactonase family protein [Pseudomonadota bacterium]